MKARLKLIKFLILIFSALSIVSCSTTHVVGDAPVKDGVAKLYLPKKLANFKYPLIQPNIVENPKIYKGINKYEYNIPIYYDKYNYLFIRIYKEGDKYVLSFEEDYNKQRLFVEQFGKAKGLVFRIKKKNLDCKLAYPIIALTFEKPYLLLRYIPDERVCRLKGKDRETILEGDVRFAIFEKLDKDAYENFLAAYISDLPIQDQKLIVIKTIRYLSIKNPLIKDIIYQILVDLINGNQKIAKHKKEILEAFAKKKLPKDIVEKKDEKGLTLLHLAILNSSDFRHQTDILKLLLEIGANPNIQDNKGNTPLHYIFYRNLFLEDYKINNLILLLRYGADPNIKNKQGETPFTDILSKLPTDKNEAKRYEYIDRRTGSPRPILTLVKVYLKGGADLGLANGKNKYPLDIVLEKEFKADDEWRLALGKVADLFIEKNAKVSRVNLDLYFLHKGENVYDLAYLFELRNKYPKYRDFIDEQIEKNLDRLEDLLRRGEIKYIRLGNNVNKEEKIVIPVTTKVYISLLGERKISNFDEFFGKSSTWYDYGYLINYEGKKYPSLDAPIYAGGDAKNALVYEENTVAAGIHRVVIKTDKNHSYGDWRGYPPDIIDPKNWGLRIAFPNIGKDSVFIIKSILNKHPNTKFTPKLRNILSLAQARANKEARDKAAFKAVENKDLFTLVSFIKNNPNNIYVPKAEALAAVKDFKYTSKYIAMSKIILTEGRLLPPSESAADRIAKFFGLPPKDYGEDEVVVRGANIEFRGRNLYISGIVQNKGKRTVNVNLLGLFRFKTIEKTQVLIFFTQTNHRYSFKWDLFKIPNLKPGERRAFTFKIVSGKGSGINLGIIGKSASRTFLEKYHVLPYISNYFYITSKEANKQRQLLKEVGLYNVNLSKINVGRVQDIIASTVKGSESLGSSGPSYVIEAAQNASVEVVKEGGGYQVDIVPRDLCSDHNFIALTSTGQKNTNPYDQLDFSYLRFPVTITVRYKGGCGFLGGSGKNVYIKVRLKKPGAYRIFIYPR